MPSSMHFGKVIDSLGDHADMDAVAINHGFIKEAVDCGPATTDFASGTATYAEGAAGCRAKGLPSDLCPTFTGLKSQPLSDHR